jgi:hypothetical protein
MYVFIDLFQDHQRRLDATCLNRVHFDPDRRNRCHLSHDWLGLPGLIEFCRTHSIPDYILFKTSAPSQSLSMYPHSIIPCLAGGE